MGRDARSTDTSLNVRRMVLTIDGERCVMLGGNMAPPALLSQYGSRQDPDQ